MHFGARDYVAQHKLSPDIFLPGNIWAEIGNPDTFTNWTYDLVNYVRCISHSPASKQ